MGVGCILHIICPCYTSHRVICMHIVMQDVVVSLEEEYFIRCSNIYE